MYQIISAAFCVIVILSNVVSAKMVPMGGLFIPVGLFTYPLTFLLSDLVAEIYGLGKAKRMVYITLAMNVLAWGMVQIALLLPGQSVEDERIFQAVLGLSGARIFASLAAYSVAQFIDVQLYTAIRRWTGPQFLWVRANGSTWVSQFIDTILLDLIYLWWGMGLSLVAVMPVMCFSIAYKCIFSIALTPLFYLCVFLIRNIKGKKGEMYGDILKVEPPSR